MGEKREKSASLKGKASIFAPPGATFLPNPRSTVDSPQTVTFGKITKSSMFERMVERVPNRLQSSPSLCGLPESSTEGFRTQIPRPTISWSCWSTLKCVRHLNFRDLVKISKNRVFLSKSQDFLRFDSGKPLQTFSTSTELRVRCSVRFLYHHSL